MKASMNKNDFINLLKKYYKENLNTNVEPKIVLESNEDFYGNLSEYYKVIIPITIKVGDSNLVVDYILEDDQLLEIVSTYLDSNFALKGLRINKVGGSDYYERICEPEVALDLVANNDAFNRRLTNRQHLY